jgi:hypothetical protein
MMYNRCMDDILKADIFFFITTISITLVTIGLLIIFYYVVRIMREATDISRMVREETEEIRNDVREARLYIREEVVKLKYILGFIRSFMKESKETLRKHRKRVPPAEKETTN